MSNTLGLLIVLCGIYALHAVSRLSNEETKIQIAGISSILHSESDSINVDIQTLSQSIKDSLNAHFTVKLSLATDPKRTKELLFQMILKFQFMVLY